MFFDKELIYRDPDYADNCRHGKDDNRGNDVVLHQIVSQHGTGNNAGDSCKNSNKEICYRFDFRKRAYICQNIFRRAGYKEKNKDKIGYVFFLK